MVMAIITFSREAPIVALMAKARMRFGKAMRASTIRCITMSVGPLRVALMIPNAAPMETPIKVDTMLTYRDIREPRISRLRMSRPNLSAPSV